MRDLFGEIAVSVREVELWLFKVPKLPHYATRRAWYVNGYNVISKIQRAKQRGELAAVFGDESCEFCGQTLAQDKEDILSPICPIAELSRLRRRVMVLEVLTRPGVRQTSELLRQVP